MKFIFNHNSLDICEAIGITKEEYDKVFKNLTYQELLEYLDENLKTIPHEELALIIAHTDLAPNSSWPSKLVEYLNGMDDSILRSNTAHFLENRGSRFHHINDIGMTILKTRLEGYTFAECLNTTEQELSRFLNSDNLFCDRLSYLKRHIDKFTNAELSIYYVDMTMPTSSVQYKVAATIENFCLDEDLLKEKVALFIKQKTYD